jgi:hypothetical protein
VRVLVFERNLLWSSKLLNGLRGLGHEGVMAKQMPVHADGAEFAIINLSEPDPSTAVSRLHEMGVKVIGHAGHKEKELLELGRAAEWTFWPPIAN